VSDLWRFIVGVFKQTTFVLTGTVIAVVLVLWPHAAPLLGPRVPREIPDRPFWGLVALFFFWATFLAWREEHAKVAPRTTDAEEWRRPQFEKALATLSPAQEGVLLHVARVGDCDALQLQQFFSEQGVAMSAGDADMLLTTLADTGLLEVKAKGNAYGRYTVKPVWEKLVIERAAAPTPVEIRITDKARELRRQLDASFEDWPQGPRTLEELVRWAHKVARGYKVTKLGFQELVDLRAEASHHVRKAIGIARDHFDAAADIVNPVVRTTWEVLGEEADPARSATAKSALQKAVRHVRQSLAALNTLTRD